MKKKPWFILLAALVLLSLALPAIADDVPEFTIAVRRNAQQYINQDELPFWQKVQEDLGIKINWIEIPSTSVTEKVNLMLAGGDLPDAFIYCVSNDMLANYYDQDVFLCVDDYIDTAMPNLSNIFEQRPQYRALATLPDGHMYGFPYIEEMYGLVLTPGPFFINTVWLEKVGKEMPTTVEEFKDVLMAFRDAGDLNGNGLADEIPYTLDFGNTNSFDSYDTFNQFCNAFGMQNTAAGRANDYLAIVDGKVVFTAADPAYRETCKFFNELYTENLIDINAFTPGADRSIPPFSSVISSSDVAIYGVFSMWNILTYMQDADVAAQYAPLPRMTGPTGRKTGEVVNLSEMQEAARFVITTECEDPDTLIKLADYIYKPEISVQANNGMAGYLMQYDENGCLRENMDENGNLIFPEGSGWKNTNDARYNTRGEKMASAVLNEYYDVLVSYDFGAKPILAGQRVNGKDEVLSELTAFPPILLSADEAAIVSQIQPTLKNMVESYRMSAIMTGNADEAWEGYLQNLKNAGLDQLLSVYESAYARYLENIAE